MKRATAGIVLLLALLCASGASAATLQRIGSFDDPIYVSSDPSNPERLLVVERGGRIVVSEDGATRTLADISDVVSTAGEGGLLSIAVPPDFASSGNVFVYYTGKEQSPAEIHVAELQTGSGALRNLLTIPHPVKENHYGGQLQIGPEGALFISTGDGGGANDELENAQRRDSLLGKILRIDPRPSGLLPYTVPANNPFLAEGGDAQLVWSYGLRNPFRFSFDRQTSAMLIGDVGQSAREEVDQAVYPTLGGGANYGWACREGTEPGPRAAEAECTAIPASGFTEPIFDYPHDDLGFGSRAAIIGGYVVRDQSLDGLLGRYLYGDYGSGEVRSFSLASPYATDRYEGLQVPGLQSFGEDACGRLYAASGQGGVFRFAGSAPASCGATAKPPTSSPKAISYIGLKAERRRVKRNKRASITAWVSPCAGRRGQPVRLLRAGHAAGGKRLGRACTATFRPRIRKPTNFRVMIREDDTYVAATSRTLRIKIDRRKGKRHRRR